MRRATIGLLAPLVLAAPIARAWTTPAPADYGHVELRNYTSAAGMAPAQFDHWRHRPYFTCRLCHVDIGFAMTAGETRVSSSTNKSGFHCGACHNGKTVVDGKAVFAACGPRTTPVDEARCQRCHHPGDAAQRRKAFEMVATRLPRKGSSGEIDWERAELLGRIRPADQIEGVSIPRRAIQMDKDVTIDSRGWKTGVVFSHRKHASWNGCEVCHPDIYPHSREAPRPSMVEINSGVSCGACHGKVAFSLGACERCHRIPVQ